MMKDLVEYYNRDRSGPKGDGVVGEFKSRAVTVEDYLRARDLMVYERMSVWNEYVSHDYESDKLAELIEAYDLVIDSMTCLAMEVDKNLDE